MMYELMPTNGRKSFNRKALVLEESDGKVLLKLWNQNYENF